MKLCSFDKSKMKSTTLLDNSKIDKLKFSSTTDETTKTICVHLLARNLKTAK